MSFKIFKRKWSAKITPSTQEENVENNLTFARTPLEMRVVRLHNVMRRYGGCRCPQIDLYETWKERGELIQWRYVPNESTVIFISHEWVGTDHPDPDGTQMYHLLLLLERLRRRRRRESPS